MRIFIDESGSFASPIPPAPSVCCVCSLAVPESCLDDVVGGYQGLVTAWNLQGAEPKGSRLDEGQVSQVVTLLRQFDVVLIVTAIDMGLHPVDLIADHKRGQQQRITAKLGPEHPPPIHETLHAWATRLGDISEPLYAEAVMLTEMLARSLQTLTLHYAQTEPPTLGTFAWRIDAKDKEPTEYERLWTEIVKPMLQAISLKEPHISVNEFDYSAMTPFENEVRSEVPAHLREGSTRDSRTFHSFNVRRLVEDLEFEDSVVSPGLQLADILGNAFRRACKGHLGREGWEHLGKLMVRGLRSGQAVDLIRLSSGKAPPPVRNRPYGSVISHLNAQARAWEMQRPA